MPKVVIKRQSQGSPSDVFSRVKNMLDDNQDLKKLDPSYKCTFDDSSLSGAATGKLFKANMVVRSLNSGSEVEITVDLPLALALAKGLVQKTLEKKLVESLA